MARTRTREYPFPERTTADRKRQIAGIVWSIALDGPFYDDGGGASELLRQCMIKRGIHVEKGNLNNIMKEMDRRGGKYGHLIQRDVHGKRTNAIELKVNVHKDLVPENPWPASTKAAFQGVGDPEAVEVDAYNDGFDDLEETFTRQALTAPANGHVGVKEDPLERVRRISATMAEEPEPEPEPDPEPIDETEPVDEPEPEPEPEEAAEEPTTDVVGELARITTVPVPGVPEVNIPNVDAMLSGLGVGTTSTNGRGSFSGLLNQAMSLISEALIVQIDQERNRQQGDAFDVAKLVDDRMAAYVALIERNQRLEEGLRRSLSREQELVELVRTLQAIIDGRTAENSASV